MLTSKKFAAVILSATLLFAESACQEEPTKPTKAPTAQESRKPGPVRPADRPPKPAEGVEMIAGCPVNAGIIVDIYHGIISKSQGENRVGKEATFVLRWVNDYDHPSGNGGCWQQTGFTDPNADRRLDRCNIEGQKTDGLNWPSCMRDG
jgi:hypothetical protein